MSEINTNAKEWIFTEYRDKGKDREVESDSSSSKHYKELNVNESLVRELIQNSLDAAVNYPINIKIQFKKIRKNKCAQYFESLEGHYEAAYEKSITLDREVSFLTLEDFDTTGLEGKKGDDFLWKDNIRSDSGSSSGGSHGIGKVVFYMASQIKTFFAYSVHEGGDIFGGACDFKTHSMDTKKYKEYGRLKLNSKDDKEFIQELFSRTENQKGLSIAIPLPTEIEIDKLREAIVREYYYPIIDEKLITELIESRIGQNFTLDQEWAKETSEIKIDQNFILEQEGAKETLVSEYVTSPPTNIVTIEIGSRYNRDKSSDEFLTPDEKEQITSKFNNGREALIRFNFSIQSKMGYLYFLIKEKNDGKKEKYDFWREKLLIREASKRNSSSPKYAVVVLIYVKDGEDNELSSMLRKLENPSHTKWNHSDLSEEIKDKYKNIPNLGKFIPKLVKFMTQLPNKIVSLIETSGTELDSNFFSDLFPDALAVAETPSRNQSAQHIGHKVLDIDGDSNPNFIFRESRKHNGFILLLSDKGKQREISRVDITLAYGTNGGNPFRNYDSRDFDLEGSDIYTKIENGEQIVKKENRLSCNVANDDFEISLSGFDPDRELKIDIKERQKEQ